MMFSGLFMRGGDKLAESETVKPICPKCFKPKGYVDGTWICFTRWQGCGINNMESTERRLFVEQRLSNVLALLLDIDTYHAYSKEVYRAILLKAAGDTRWEWHEEVTK